MKIVSFDPASFRNLGWAIVEDTEDGMSFVADTFVCPEIHDVWQAYWPIFQFVDKFISETAPDIVIVENTKAFRASSGSFVTGQVSHCLGVIYVVCGKYNIPVEFVLPTSVKMGVAGHGKASKSQIKKAVQEFAHQLTGKSNVKYSSEHAYDSVSNILHYMILNNKVKQLEEFPWLTEKQIKTVKKRKKNAQQMES